MRLSAAIDCLIRYSGLQGPELEKEFGQSTNILWTPLHTAASFGHLPVVKFLVEREFNVFV